MESNNELSRRQTKSTDGAFLYELQHGYELSPKLSEQILITAKEMLSRSYHLAEGEIEVTVIGIDERSGKLLETMEKRRVCLTVDAGYEDIQTLKDYGRVVLRQNRVQRLCEQAIEQRGLLSQEDLSRYLSCSIRTIKRDIKAIKERGIEVLTRGVLHNIGRGQTHKVKIIGLYLEGLTYSEIKRQTRHSTSSIKRYFESFIKVLLAQRRGINRRREISQVTGLSEYLVRQYQQLIRDSKKDPIRSRTLEDLIGRHSYKPVIKKRTVTDGLAAAAKTGGSGC